MADTPADVSGSAASLLRGEGRPHQRCRWYSSSGVPLLSVVLETRSSGPYLPTSSNSRLAPFRRMVGQLWGRLRHLALSVGVPQMPW
jgi:hypothetical protein